MQNIIFTNLEVDKDCREKYQINNSDCHLYYLVGRWYEDPEFSARFNNGMITVDYELLDKCREKYIVDHDAFELTYRIFDMHDYGKASMYHPLIYTSKSILGVTDGYTTLWAVYHYVDHCEIPRFHLARYDGKNIQWLIAPPRNTRNRFHCGTLDYNIADRNIALSKFCG